MTGRQRLLVIVAHPDRLVRLIPAVTGRTRRNRLVLTTARD
jgi:hypothetical protein